MKAENTRYIDVCLELSGLFSKNRHFKCCFSLKATSIYASQFQMMHIEVRST